MINQRKKCGVYCLHCQMTSDFRLYLISYQPTITFPCREHTVKGMLSVEQRIVSQLPLEGEHVFNAVFHQWCRNTELQTDPTTVHQRAFYEAWRVIKHLGYEKDKRTGRWYQLDLRKN